VEHQISCYFARAAAAGGQSDSTFRRERYGKTKRRCSERDVTAFTTLLPRTLATAPGRRDGERYPGAVSHEPVERTDGRTAVP